MVRFGNVLASACIIITIFCLVSATGCSRDQSSSTQQTAPSPQMPAAAQSAPTPAPVVAPPAPAPPQQQAVMPAPIGPQNAGQIQVGMTSQQVVQILGNPARVEQERQGLEWKYYFPQGGKFEVYFQNDRVVAMKLKTH